MHRSLDKKFLALILFFSAVLLIALNVLLNKLYPEKNAEEQVIEITTAEASHRFIEAVMSCGFEESWIEEYKNENDKEFYSYRVKVPPDVPIALLIREISSRYSESEAEIIVEEKKINGVNYLKVYSGGKLKLASDFTYTPGISRKGGIAGTLILDAEQLNSKNFSAILDIPEQFAVVLTPSKKSGNLTKEVTSRNKEFAVLLNDNINELDYKLGSDFGESRIKDVIRTIVGSFSGAVFYIIDSGSSIYNSPAGRIIENEFAKRKIKLIPTNKLISFRKGESRLDDLIDRIDTLNHLLAIPAEIFISLTPEFDKFRNIGYKFINPSAVIL